MNEQERKFYLSRLAQLEGKERQKILKEAASMRDLAQRRESKKERYLLDDEQPLVRRSRPLTTLQDYAIRILKTELDEISNSLEQGSLAGLGQIVWLGPDRCTLELEGERVTALIPPQGPELWRTKPTVGDWAKVHKRGDELWLSGLEPRKSYLSRPDPAGSGELMVVANVDVIAVVVSVVAPPLHTRIIDRYWIAIQRGGAECLLVVNKIDLLAGHPNPQEELDLLEPYRQAKMPIILGSALKPDEAIEQLRDQLEGKTCAFVGHSGVGKSSLLNALCPELQVATGEVSSTYGRGTHTTTASSLYDLGRGTRLIDTPGIRSFGLGKMTREELLWGFPEFEEPAMDCKYRDCSHIREPNCGVRKAVQKGELARSRFETYVNLWGDVVKT